ncbi:glycerol-3-phosphate dehydrogenase [Hamiltosporidium magnivora]|uniref:Glycerol-3-phosphate dehydrogenase n=1 Tax=Hamiltosporidium magnivora TaxID=148818 RepID=A0A4V2JW65_9MICR|nr:glycerol-3-phosphate dehydrogenase [Hamiltosporidium magnivora]
MKKNTKYLVGSILLGYAGYKTIKEGYHFYRNHELEKKYKKKPSLSWAPLSRNESINRMKSKEFDLLIVGGGASGSGCALDAVTRGLSVALVDAGDFGCETSSKSTKLLHGGIRYLEKAMKYFDLSQFKLVFEALHERKHIINIAPYLANKLPIMLPVYNKIMVPYFWVGLKLYDWLSGTKSIGSSYFIGKSKTIEIFPRIKKDNLSGSVIYYDGQMDDSRLNLMLALTSSYHGAVISNYVEVKNILKENDISVGATCTDKITGETFKIKSKGIINTTGPFTDSIRKDTNNELRNIVVPSSGTHIVLPKEFGPKNMGFVFPQTSDGRILFFIPWKNKLIAGTTDNKCSVESNPKPSNDEINFLIDETKHLISYPDDLEKNTILSAWKGIRPLVKDPSKKNTESLARNHIIEVTSKRTITLSGGKWTTYRRMAEDAINKAIKTFKLNTKQPCVTKFIPLLGSHTYNHEMLYRIQRDLKVPLKVAKNWVSNYGDRAYKLRDYIKNDKINKISSIYDITEEDVEYTIDNEMAIKISDFILRRYRIGFIDVKEAYYMIDKVSKIMKRKFCWSHKQELVERKEAVESLKSLGLEFCMKKH